MKFDKELLVPEDYVSVKEKQSFLDVDEPLLIPVEIKERSRPGSCLSTLLSFILYVALFLATIWTLNQAYLYSCSQFDQINEKATIEIILENEIIISAEHNDLIPETKDLPSEPSCKLTSVGQRFDCFPGASASKAACEARGCCWGPVGGKRGNVSGSSGSVSVPWCYFPKRYSAVQYQAESVKETEYGYQISIQNFATAAKWPPKLINKLRMDLYFESNSRIHFKIVDPQAERYQVPIDTPVVRNKATNPDYDVKILKKPLGLVISRKKTGAVVFDSTIAPILYGDQYLQLSTKVPTGFVYGLGEHRSIMMHNLSSWDRLSYWARDQPPTVHANLYGVHPFYVTIEKGGEANGVFFLNSNAMDIDTVPYPALTYRTIGGVLDFYVFLGPTPSSVVQEYISVIGRPAFPPYWALGFHLCRYGYKSSDDIKTVVKRMRDAGFPYDSQWSDIDYMDKYYDWTYDKNKFAGLPDLIKDLHANDQYFVIIVDPGISNQSPGKYPPYDNGLKYGVFINDSNGNPIKGRVWPGETVFPDFTNPRTEQWWYESARDFHQEIEFDGLWTDMNEPSNFGSGSTTGCTGSDLDNPPYTPAILGGKLQDKTLCPSAKQHLGSHYNVHSLFGHFETKASHRALLKIRNKRTLVITRSSFVGTGQYAGHWTGDNRASWDDLYYSIPAMMSFQMFGIPFVGADICGFGGDTTEELCTRWMQLGAYYPFMRNHNSLGQKDQDPAVFSQEAQERMQIALNLRYNLLPYLYTLLYRSHVNGSLVINPLSFVYPNDPLTYAIDRQFMWGTGLLITPVLTKGATTVKGYIPNDVWYTGEGKRFPESGRFVDLQAPLEIIPLMIRGGTIIPWQNRREGDTTTGQSRLVPFSFNVALNSKNEAFGELYWDDGDTINATESGLYNLFQLNVSQSKMTSTVIMGGYKPKSGLWMEVVTLLGLKTTPKTVLVNGVSTKFIRVGEMLSVSDLHVDMMKTWTVEWK